MHSQPAGRGAAARRRLQTRGAAVVGVAGMQAGLGHIRSCPGQENKDGPGTDSGAKDG